MSEFPAAPPDDYGMTLDAEDGTVAEFRDPVSVVFGGHGGRVIDIRCSPFHRDIFASAGSDHEGIPDFEFKLSMNFGSMWNSRFMFIFTLGNGECVEMEGKFHHSTPRRKS